ncbi:MAG: hypothetical protein R3B13_18275 [Polyangiaceae bacterium]
MASRKRLALGLVAMALLGGTGCGSAARPFPLREPLWRDPDQRPFAEQPEEYYSPFAWDAANHTVFRPVSRFFAVDPAGEAVNVNALDEVPNSSWFQNRLGRFSMNAEEVARGPCASAPPDVKGPWVVTAAKPNGFNPGFFMKAPDGSRYLTKFDGTIEGTRPTAADIIAPRLAHAAGYFVPCNRIVYFDRSILRIDPKAKSENESGDKVPMTDRDLDTIFSKALRLPDGRYRASVSLFIEGKPLGPWSYEGRRGDDPNDVVNHEDRRELRGLAVFAAWLGWTDTREQNTMAAFVKSGPGGYVRHYLLDVGNCFGSIWDPPMLGRRISHSYYLDVPYILEDFATLGTQRRPWDELRFGPTGRVFGYFDAEHFDPDLFRTGYPNPAFIRRSEADSAWMARIIARFDRPLVRSAVEQADLTPPLKKRLLSVLMGRRTKLLARYFSRLAPLSWPRISTKGARPRLCMEDLAVTSGVANAARRDYAARAYVGSDLNARGMPRPDSEPRGLVCAELPQLSASRQAPEYLIVDLATRPTAPPARVHLYQVGQSSYQIVGLERPDSNAPPEGAT